ncbi:MAG: NAD(P)-dependent oxidoreductase [Vulcanococcus sp.]|uniref:NAD(P)-dependent oxidoreductase n=1 Tax=Vulcanococcus sp. TaxID=2856995 RepID=UPI0025DFEC62|nr:NAD(P)-dependent oxidoreductase [Vulcanococcus sp.]MBW0166070.1 NAD(P)-dependent oxidoreductase [Vulcanococcus sp.]
MTIALLGTGLLGSAIATRLLACGHSLSVWNRHPERCQPLLELGARQAPSPAAAAAEADWLLTVLSDGPTTHTVLIDQVAEELRGRRVLQIGTIGPAESRQLSEAVMALGGSYLEAPVLGSRPEALNGTLQLMTGGPAELMQEARPLLQQLSQDPVHLGPVGSAMTAKLALNQLIASLTHAFSLSLHLVQQGGVEVEPFMALLRSSALYAPTFDKKLQRELSGDYTNPNFPTAHLRKDLDLFITAAQQAGLNSKGLSGLAALLQRSSAAGLDELDYCALHQLTAGQTTAATPD